MNEAFWHLTFLTLWNFEKREPTVLIKKSSPLRERPRSCPITLVQKTHLGFGAFQSTFRPSPTYRRRIHLPMPKGTELLLLS